MSQTRPIVILTASAGAGHMVAARAIAETLRPRVGDAPVIVHDVLQSTNAFFRTLYADGYLGIVRYAPVAMGWLYDAMDKPAGRLRGRLRATFQNINAYHTMARLIRWRPRLILNTHFLSAEIVAHMRRTRRLRCPQATITTDFETHRIWMQAPTERYYTATEDGRTYLEACGVPRGIIRVTGIPVRRAFVRHGDRCEIRRRNGFEADRPLVLLLCGGFGVGPTEALLAALRTTAPAVQILAIAGRNAGLRKRLEAQCAGELVGRVRVLGFTDRMNEWMRAADLVVTKPGGLTASEALACGLPMVVVNPIPGQETRNSDYLLERGAAIKVNSPQMLGHRVQGLLDDPRRMALLRQCALRLARPNAAERIVEDAMELLESGSKRAEETRAD